MFHFSSNNFNQLYALIEATKLQLYPLHYNAVMLQEWLGNSNNPLTNTEYAKWARASLTMAERMMRTYEKPKFDIYNFLSNKKYDINLENIIEKPFCHLKHFKKVILSKTQPKLLMVAPLAGHHATLLTSTVAAMLPDFDVYITDWVNANQVPLSSGSFDLDDFIDYMIEFIQFLSPEINIMAVCQPTVPILAATAILSELPDKHNIPKSLVLIGGPVDARQNPTTVNNFATSKDIEWFEQMVITTVPANYPGYMRKVYPGFLQLLGFISMNLTRHTDAHLKIFKDLLSENYAAAEKSMKFYDEYFSVMDLPAEFYLQTIKEVFQDFALAKGTLKSRNRIIDLHAITDCALLGVEGQNDDIAAVGQTKAALSLCKNIPESKKRYHLQEDVGHYGVFSGSKFTSHIAPVIKDFINSSM